MKDETENHNDDWCDKYNEPVMPDESGNCSLCGSRLYPTPEEDVVCRECRKMTKECTCI